MESPESGTSIREVPVRTEADDVIMETIAEEVRNGDDEEMMPVAALFGLPTVIYESKDEVSNWFRRGGDSDM